MSLDLWKEIIIFFVVVCTKKLNGQFSRLTITYCPEVKLKHDFNNFKRNIKYTKAYNQYYYSFESKLHYPCFFTRGQGNIHRPHLWECACVCVCVYECLCTNTCWQGQTVWMWVWEQGCIKAVCEVSGALFVHVCVRLRCHCVPASILPPWTLRSPGCL